MSDKMSTTLRERIKSLQDRIDRLDDNDNEDVYIHNITHLGKTYSTIIDNDPYILDLLHQKKKWVISNSKTNGKEKKYIRSSGKKPIYLHRYLLYHTFGDIPDGYIIDHLNGNSLDNRLDNLIITTRQWNVINRDCRGYYFVRNIDMYRVQILANNVVLFDQYFDCPYEAREAYLNAWSEYVEKNKNKIILNI